MTYTYEYVEGNESSSIHTSRVKTSDPAITSWLKSHFKDNIVITNKTGEMKVVCYAKSDMKSFLMNGIKTENNTDDKFQLTKVAAEAIHQGIYKTPCDMTTYLPSSNMLTKFFFVSSTSFCWYDFSQKVWIQK